MVSSSSPCVEVVLLSSSAMIHVAPYLASAYIVGRSQAILYSKVSAVH